MLDTPDTANNFDKSFDYRRKIVTILFIDNLPECICCHMAFASE
jgi:hypothetical protein